MGKSPIKDEIRFDDGEIEGYGGPGSFWVRVTYRNLLLDKRKTYSQFELGKITAQLEMKWLKDWTQEEFALAIKNKPQASPLCHHCGKDTLKGQISCVEKIFCTRCEKFIKQYQDEYSAAQQESLRQIKLRSDALEKEAEQKRQSIIQDFCSNM